MQAVKPKPGLQVSLDLRRVPHHAAQGQAVPRLCKTTSGSQVRGLSAGASSHSENSALFTPEEKQRDAKCPRRGFSVLHDQAGEAQSGCHRVGEGTDAPA